MLGAFKTFSVIMVAMLVVAAFTLPHVCLADDATSKVAIHADHQVDNFSHHGKPSKAADHCCVASHCCVAKILGSGTSVSVQAVFTKTVLSTGLSQHIATVSLQGLDRPPKSIL